MGGLPLGDVWPCPTLLAQDQTTSEVEPEALVPFHKLTGWLTYSLIEPIQKLLGWSFDGLDDLTGLPEYRNGACTRFRLVPLIRSRTRRPLDRPRRADTSPWRPGPDRLSGGEQHPTPTSLSPSRRRMARHDGDRIVRLVLASVAFGSTFSLRDRIAQGLRDKFNLSRESLTLAQVLESATWKGGREVAKQRRSDTGGPPIDIISDGTVF